MNNSFKIKTGLNVEPKTGSTVTTKGDVAYNDSTAQVEVYTTAAESISTASNTQTFTNKSIAADGTGNSITNIADTNIKTGAAIARAKLASGTANHVIINDSGGAFSSEATLAKTRGGTGQDNSSLTFPSTGTVQATTPNNHGVLISGAGATATVIAPNASTAFPLISGGSSADPSWAKLSEAGGGTNQTTYTSGDILYASATNTLSKLGVGSANQVLQISNGLPSWQTAPVGGINYLSANPNAEVDTSGWSTYADAAQNIPVDATAGSPSSTWTRTTSSPLRGTGSFLWTKAGSANRQGEGVSYAFTIDTADKAKPLAITFDYIISSGTFTASNGTTAPLNDGTTSTNAGNSDLEVFIYDVTNAVLIPVSPQVLTSNSSSIPNTFKATFQTASNSTSYRLAIHTATNTTNNFTVEFDNFFVGPQSVSYGPPVTDWVAYTPTISAWSTNTSATGQYRRVGDTLELQIAIALTGAPTGTLSSISIPSGLTIDTTKIPNYAAGTGIFGVCNIQAAASGQFLADVLIASTTTIKPAVYSASGSFVGGDNNITATVPATFASGDFVKLVARVPIVGWSSTALMSNDTDTRIVALLATSASTSITGSDTTVINGTVVTDTHGAYNSSTGTYTIPVSGNYEVGVNYYSTTALTNAAVLAAGTIKKNGTAVIAINRQTSVANAKMMGGGSCIITAVSGDTITFTLAQNDGTNRSLDGSTANNISIKRLSGPSAIAATESVNLKYFNTAGTSFSTIVALPYAVKVFDSHNAYNTSTGVFTAPISGKYAYSASVISLTNLGSSNDWDLQMIKNSSTLVDIDRRPGAGGADTYQSLKFSGIIDLLAGDTLTVKIENSSGTMTLNSTSGYNQLSIWRIGN